LKIKNGGKTTQKKLVPTYLDETTKCADRVGNSRTNKRKENKKEGGTSSGGTSLKARLNE
jgi:hypothetical protein